jgi:formiminotetrahydrofolate cyclodeaminase
MENFDEFLERLASPTAAPGGGAASAAVSVIAASINAMVSGITMEKKSYSAFREMMSEIKNRSESAAKDLRKLMKDDETAFNLIVSAWKMPKGTPDQIQERNKKMNEAIRQAVAVPWKIAQKSMVILQDSLLISRHGLKSAITDSMCSAEFSASAIRGVLQNVAINIKDADADFRESESIKMRLFLEDTENLYRSVKKTVNEKMGMD